MKRGTGHICQKSLHILSGRDWYGLAEMEHSTTQIAVSQKNNATEVSHIRRKIRPKRKKRRLKSVPKRTKKLFFKVRTDTYEYALSGGGKENLVFALMPSLFSLQIYDTFSQRSEEATLTPWEEGGKNFAERGRGRFLKLWNFLIFKMFLS